MSMEEDFLMRKVREIVRVLKSHDAVTECGVCSTLVTDADEKCPNCGELFGEAKAAEQRAQEGPVETVGGQEDSYEARSREELQKEVGTRESLRFATGVSGMRKAELVELLRQDDQRAFEARAQG